MKRLIAALLSCATLLSLAACAPKARTAEEVMAEIQPLVEQENAIFDADPQLWMQLLAAVDPSSPALTDGTNFGDILLDAIPQIQQQLSPQQLETLQTGAEEIRALEEQLEPLRQEYLALEEAQGGGETAQGGQFPSFSGTDLEGNAVDSQELFAGNAVTVVNFWFTTCGPCVNELGELEALDQQLQEQGGALVGINVFTLDGDQEAIAEAKDTLAAMGADYQNIYFDTDSPAGQFAAGVMSFPTTYVVDRQGNIVGNPIVGAVTVQRQMDQLQALIDQAIQQDGQ